MSDSPSEPLLTLRAAKGVPPSIRALLVGVVVVMLGLFTQLPLVASVGFALLLLFTWIPVWGQRRHAAGLTLRFFTDHLELVGEGRQHLVPWSSVEGLREDLLGVKVRVPLAEPVYLPRLQTMRARRELKRALPELVPLELRPLGAQPGLVASWAVVIGLGLLLWMVEL